MSLDDLRVENERQTHIDRVEAAHAAAPLQNPGSTAQDTSDASPDGFLINPHGLEIKETAQAGRGVFAPRDFPTPGTILEESPVLLLTQQEWEQGRLDDGVLGGYGFNWSNGGMAVGLGMASMFNHSPTPNVTFARRAPTSKTPTIQPGIIFRTARPIRKGDELCICYSADESKLWFSPDYAKSTAPMEAQARAASSNGDGPYEVRLGNAEAGPSRLVSSEAPLLPILDDFASEDPDKAEHKQRKKTDRDDRRRKWAEKIARKAAAAAVRAAHPDPLPAETELANGSSEAGSDRKSRSRQIAHDPDSVPVLQPKPISVNALSESESIPSSASGISTPLATSMLAREPAYPQSTDTGSTPPRLKSQRTIASIHDEAYKAALEDLHMVDNLVVDEDEVQREQDRIEGQSLTAKGDRGAWDEIVRVKGPVEEDGRESEGTLDVWVLVVPNGPLTKVVLDWLKLEELSGEELKHIKRINRLHGETSRASGISLIALGTVAGSDFETVRSSLNTFSPKLADCELRSQPVPTSPASSQEEWARKNKIWPVPLAQKRPHIGDMPWCATRRAWVRTGIRRVVEAAQGAGAQGELPIAVHATCPPAEAILLDPSNVEPTPNIRAEGFDTRNSTSHPLKHAAMDCVARIAHLRTVPPFSATLSLRNGADYLLTSLSLFTTHEPCVMCTMALVHSRVKEIFFVLPSVDGGGGLGSAFPVHGYPGLNHRIDVYNCSSLTTEEEREFLRLPVGTNV